MTHATSSQAHLAAGWVYDFWGPRGLGQPFNAA